MERNDGRNERRNEYCREEPESDDPELAQKLEVRVVAEHT